MRAISSSWERSGLSNVDRNCTASVLCSAPKGLVRFGAGARPPLERVVRAALARPGVEDVDDGAQLVRELRQRAKQHALQRRDLLVVAVRLSGFPPLAVGAVVVHPAQAEVRVVRGPVARGQEAVAEETP